MDFGQLHDPAEVFAEAVPEEEAEKPVEGEETLKAESEATEPTEEPKTEPETNANVFRIGDEDVSLEDIEALWAGREFVEGGKIYAEAIAHFERGPEGAAAVIAQFIDAARETYKDKFVMPELPADLDEEQLTDVESILNAQTKRMQSEIRVLREEYARTLAELKDATAQKLARDAAPAWVAAVKSQYPDADVSHDQLTAWMREFKTKDPVAAYRQGTYDQLRTGSKPVEATPPTVKEKPLMPRGNSGERFFDPHDPQHSLADFQRMLDEGMKPDPNAKKRG